MTYRVQYTRRALKELSKVHPRDVERVRRFMEDTLDLTDLRSRGTPLVGRDEWRYRVGDHRLLCRIDDHAVTLMVVRVAHRREVYR